MREMWAISLWQPWASLLFTPAKKHETRSWPPPKKVWGQRIAIHAAKKHVVDVEPELNDVIQTQMLIGNLPLYLPQGAILGTAVLESWQHVQMPAELLFTPDDIVCGDLSIGRCAWKLTDHELFDAPIPWKGAQGFFHVQVPDGR